MYVGVLTVNDLHTVAGSLGINLDPGDLEADANAVADYINARGGIFGRRLKMLFRDTKTFDVACFGTVWLNDQIGCVPFGPAIVMRICVPAR